MLNDPAKQCLLTPDRAAVSSTATPSIAREGVSRTNVQPALTISVVSHGQWALMQPLLDQLLAVSRQMPLCVIVTHNLPEPSVAITSDEDFQVVFVQNDRPRGFGENHNAAFRLSSSPYFCVLNPDVRLDAASLSSLLGTVERRPGVAGPRVQAPDEGIEDSARRVPTVSRLTGRWLRRRFVPDYSAALAEQQVDWLAGMCLLFDRESFHSVGGFDERFFLYCEDVEICLRLHLSRRSVTWTQNATVIHDAQRASHRQGKYLALHLHSLLRLWICPTYWRFLFRGRVPETIDADRNV
jgi:GT2 family glycosyltransferase